MTFLTAKPRTANWQKWHGRMAEREAVKKAVEEKAKMLGGAKH